MRRLFRGQDEVYAVRWTNPRSGKAGYSPAVAGGWNGRPVAGRPKRHLPLTDEVVGEHLLLPAIAYEHVGVARRHWG